MHSCVSLEKDVLLPNGGFVHRCCVRCLLNFVVISRLKIEQYFPLVLFIMLYKVVLTFESVDEILKCNHSMKATEQYFPMVLFIMLYEVVLTFESVDAILKCDHSNESY